MGRSRKISVGGLAKVRAVVEDRSKGLDSVKGNYELHQLLLDQMKAEAPNNNCEPSLSDSCFTKYKATLKLKDVPHADVKSLARKRAFEDVRNSLSLCTVLSTIQGEVESEHYLSSDDVSILLNGWDKPTVITTQEAQKFMDAQNIGISTTEEEKKRRVVAFNVTLAGDGTVVCTVVQFADMNFVELKEAPVIYKMQKGLYVLLYHPALDKTVLATYMYRLCIIKCAVSKRKEALQRDLGGLAAATVTLTQSSSSSVAAASAPSSQHQHQHQPAPTDDTEESLRQKHKRSVLASDGAIPQIKAMQKSLIGYEQDKGLSIWFLKYAAACSMTQSPNDRGKCHMLLHQLFRGPRWRHVAGAEGTTEKRPGACVLSNILALPGALRRFHRQGVHADECKECLQHCWGNSLSPHQHPHHLPSIPENDSR